MMDWLTDWSQWGLAGLGLSAFLSSTVLPGNSELALIAYLTQWPQQWVGALALASLGNTLGGATNIWMGVRMPTASARFPRAQAYVQRWGAPILLLSWVPVIGDVLCVAAGWLRLPVVPLLFWLALGKTLRYAVLCLPFIST